MWSAVRAVPWRRAAGSAVVERLALFGRAWSELAAKDVAAAKVSAKALADAAVRTRHPEATAYAGIAAGAIDLAEGRAADAVRRLETLDAYHPLVQALLAEAYTATNRADKAALLKAALARPSANHLDLAYARRRAGVK
jgi:hypothetical protein